MALEDIAKHYYKTEGYNCAETLLHSANEYYDLGLHDHDMRTMAGFGGGMFVGSVCGALVGAQAALSAMIVEDRAHHQMEDIRPASQRLHRNFRNAYNAVECKDIKKDWHSKEEKCWRTVEQASRVLEQTVNELQLPQAKEPAAGAQTA
ncbi:C-GCAxxG-C-C family (seleno)protein [uncultured Faecalibaculum sp.]|uniref:C-GCAxxG-C-C family (seleno)protein n=1 Tax=uncultured Faecalibaculum sp. TaxID=1729681 RepID=UPI00261BE093|nr:C-GCAxxG-C-C family (seleno)protein [uncultured Faecalibaculum sp.]